MKPRPGAFSTGKMETDIRNTPQYGISKAAFDVGCTRDQIENFLIRKSLLQPKQLKASACARLCDHANGPVEVGMGGARGGGKSHWLLAQMGLDDCQRVEQLKCLLLRKVGKAAKESLSDLRNQVLMHTPHVMTGNGSKIEFPNGSLIITGHFQSEGDIDSYLGASV